MLLKKAIIGAPNAGRSTLLNKLIDSNISCVSKKVHTTRRNILGTYTEGSTQLGSPGLVTRDHSLKLKLERTLSTEPERAALRCDLTTGLTTQDSEETGLIPEAPIKGLDIVRRINKVKKKGSFTVDLFTGKYDHDFLTYPDPLDSRVENQNLKSQAQMVRQMWPQIWDDPAELQRYNFFNLFQLSVTEMMTIFESIGAATRKCFDVRTASKNQQSLSGPMMYQARCAQSIIELIIRNCLTYWPIHNYSQNSRVKELLPRHHIVFGKPQQTETLIPPIGFCWTEKAPNFGSLPPQEWFTMGSYGGESADYYAIKGIKQGVLYQDSMEQFMVFYRDQFLSDKHPVASKDGTNPASDPFIGCCLINKSELNQTPVYTDSAGFRYTDIEFDNVVPGLQSVFAAERNDPKGVNIKALGQVASCAVVMGILKDTLQMSYQFLTERKEGLLSCDIIQRKLSNVTSRIFAIESMVYYIAGMYDGLEEGFDAHMEATILKIVTTEMAYEALSELQGVFGSEMFILSKLQDQINMFDSFLDGSIHNRIYLATMGVIHYARSKNMHLNKLKLAPWYPSYFVRTMLAETSERSDWLTLDADIYGNLHPSLQDAGKSLEFILKRVKYAAQNLALKYGDDLMAAQASLYDMAQLTIDSFVLTTMCARASKSYCNGSRHSEVDVALASYYGELSARRARLYLDELETFGTVSLNIRQHIINEANVKRGGYYAESPLDPNI